MAINGGNPLGGLARGAKAGRVAQCALVLEDNPVGPDSRMEFQSFDPAISEGYAVAGYKELGGERMAQPGYVSYRGGNWQPFNLILNFVAGEKTVLGAGSPSDASPPDIENLLIEMESRVRWCQALTFPLERTLGSAGNRILARAKTGGVQPTKAATEATAKLRRNDPPFVLVVFGSWMTIRGYTTSVSVDWKEPYHPVSARPMGAQVAITLQPLLLEYPTWGSIRNKAGQFGYTTKTAQDKSAAEFQARQLERIAANAAKIPIIGVVDQAALAAQARARAEARAKANAAAVQGALGLGSLNTIEPGA